MKQALSFTALLLLSFTACSRIEPVESKDDAVFFDCYAARTVVKGTPVNSAEPMKADGMGFSIFGFSTGKQPYASTDQPNFMSAQKLYWVPAEVSGAWTYSPLKLWPNQTNSKLSFFSYAPYMVYDQTTDGMKKVLTWTPASTSAQNASLSAYAVRNNVYEQQDFLFTEGQTAINLEKQINGTTVNLNYAHQLARIDLYAAVKVNDGVLALDDNTTVTIEKVTVGRDLNAVNPSDEFYTAANLQVSSSGAASWVNHLPERQSFVLDSCSELKNCIFTKASGSSLKRISVDDASLMIIPQDFTTNPLHVSVKYKVVTLYTATGNEMVTNSTATCIVNHNLVKGTVYKLNLIIGLRTIEMDVDLEPWDENHTILDTNNN